MLSRGCLLGAFLLALALPALPASAGPSGSDAPTGDLPGWRLLWTDDFTGKGLGPGWYPYSGRPVGAPVAQWDPGHCRVGGGVLTLETSKDPKYPGLWTSCGVWGRAVAQAYGKYLVRFRCEKAAGVACIGLLWPSDDRWPPEVDFFEDAGGDRTRTTATLHHGANNSMIHRRSPATSAGGTRWGSSGRRAGSTSRWTAPAGAGSRVPPCRRSR